MGTRRCPDKTQTGTLGTRFCVFRPGRLSRLSAPGGGFALPGLQTLKTVTQVTVLRLFRQRPVTIVERTLHNHRIPPVAFLIAYAAQALMDALIARCEQGPWRQMIAVVGDGNNNAGSLRLHKKHGFVIVGQLRSVG